MGILVETVRYIHTKKIYLIPPVVAALLFLFSYHTRSIEIFPGISKNKIEAFNDDATGGNSQLNLFTVDSTGVTIDYTLKEKIQYPYAGIKLVLTKDSQYKNLSAYDFFSIDLAPKTPQNINIFIHTIVPGFTHESNDLSYRYLLKAFKCQKLLEHFTAPLKAFTVPTWWYELNKLPDDSLPKETYNQVAEIIVENGYGNLINTPYSFTLHSISFHKNMTTRGFLALGVCIVWFLLYSLLYLLYKNLINSHKKEVIISYEPLEVKNESDECLNRVVTCIAKEYKNPELTVMQIASKVGLPPAKVTQILREKKNCSYKQYLNAIRLAEAKRLLHETDRNIVDIARKVGYNNVTHFNRIFKEAEGVTPRQFRLSTTNNSN